MFYSNFVKPFFDFVFALVLFFLCFPIFSITAIVLFFQNYGKVFFVQRRPGKNEKIFRIIKFKTMNDKLDINGSLMADFERTTPIGNFIRKYSIDEIPQLLNIIFGEMSFIGPRPLLVEYLQYYDNNQSLRHNVKPGISGWAQINGRNTISWEKKFEMDIWYVKNISFFTDLKILFLTIKKVLKREGINASSNLTMEKFNGNDVK